MEDKARDPLLQKDQSYSSAYPTNSQVPAYNISYTIPAVSYQYNTLPTNYTPHVLRFQYPAYSTRSSYNNFYEAIMATYMLGLFIFLPHLISLILTFVMVHKDMVQERRKTAVTVLGILELISWIFCASFSWYYRWHCYSGPFTTYCSLEYWGWIAIVIWFGIALICGIPRVKILKNKKTLTLAPTITWNRMQKENLKQCLKSLQTATTVEQKKKLLHTIQGEWTYINEDISSVLQGNNLFKYLAEVIESNIETWKDNFPAWISYLLSSAMNYSSLFSYEQSAYLVQTFRKYLTSGYWKCMDSFRVLANMPHAQQALVTDDELYNILKGKVNDVLNIDEFFWAITNGSDEWQLKIISDKQFTLELLMSPSWEGIFVNLAQHSDAKELLPPEVLTKASEGSSESCTTIGALLSNDSDLIKFKLGEAWIEQTTKVLECLVLSGVAQFESIYNLLDVVLPIANLSAVDSHKELLGEKSIALLLKIITEKLPESVWVQPFVKRGSQEASRALWNFAYNESNRKLIHDANGVERLRTTLVQTQDPIVKKNIAGILYMLAPSHPTVTSSVAPQGHVMISYNWNNQPVVIRLANTLKALGFNIWLDIEKMGGSTLESMAQAIEQSDLVLICMSQKYKDSPNCRLEGEYCVNRRVKYLPLMMQPGYQPDGWLGIALGAKLYYDFTDESNWETKTSELAKAIGDSGRASVGQQLPVQASKKSVSQWSADDILVWMKEESISQHYEIFQKNRITGKALAELKRLHTSHPQIFFTTCEKIGITEYGDILELSATFHKLQL